MKIRFQADANLDPVAVIDPRITEQEDPAIMDHDLPENLQVTESLPGEVQCLPNGDSIDMFGH